jgi:hypothetical protein
MTAEKSRDLCDQLRLSSCLQLHVNILFLLKSTYNPLVVATIKPRKKAWLSHLWQSSHAEKSMTVTLMALITLGEEQCCPHLWQTRQHTFLKSVDVPFVAANTRGKEHG